MAAEACVEGRAQDGLTVAQGTHCHPDRRFWYQKGSSAAPSDSAYSFSWSLPLCGPHFLISEGQVTGLGMTLRRMNSDKVLSAVPDM